MKKLITFSLALSVISPAFAGKVNVTEEVLEEIISANALSEARVYVSDKVKIVRQTSPEKISEVDESINRVVRQSVLKEEIGKNIRGKILAIEGTLHGTIATTINELKSKFKTIYVSFDPSCKTKECSFKFRLPAEIDYSITRWEPYHYFLNSISYNYSLSEIPEVKNMTTTSLKVGRLFRDKKLFESHTTFEVEGLNRGVELLIDLEELRQITIEKKKYKGF